MTYAASDLPEKVHRMPATATLEQRLEWHVEHQKHCGCRVVPAAVKAELARRDAIVAEARRA